MKKQIILIFILSFNFCITANINQPPAVVEKSYPSAVFMNKSLDSETDNSYIGEPVPDNSSEEEFFEELSKQDPYLENCKDCKPENRPPGYITTEENLQQDQIQTDNTEVVIVQPENSENQQMEQLQEQIGIASWYGKDFDGRPTASGEIFDSRKLTAAHRTLPLGTIVIVKNLENNKEAILKINDRGPYIKNRIIDVSEYAAEVLGFKQKGLTKVQIKVLKPGNLKEKGEGATAFFFKKAEEDSGTSPYEELLESKKQEVLKQVIDKKDFKHYSVQIGAFTDIRNIIRIKEELEKKLPYPVTILRNDNEYIIRVGRFSERYPAEVLKQKLEEEGYTGFVASPEIN
ncbi:MAG: hypothetical protein KatS3mg129_2361 [Leptospiraceae bacterium]|nr:MAG: hypothetical protein KatS3mg129_2361 [Leptospiraceae bacterium]